MVGFYMSGNGIKDVRCHTHVFKRKSPILRLIGMICRIKKKKKEDQKFL